MWKRKAKRDIDRERDTAGIRNESSDFPLFFWLMAGAKATAFSSLSEALVFVGVFCI